MACDKYARGKSGLCAAHSAQLLDQQRNGGVVSPALQEPLRRTCKQANGITGRDPDGTLVIGTGATAIGSVRNGHGVLSPVNELPASFLLRSDSLDQLSLPEDRVHGGSLMAMLAGGVQQLEQATRIKWLVFRLRLQKLIPCLIGGCKKTFLVHGTTNSRSSALISMGMWLCWKRN